MKKIEIEKLKNYEVLHSVRMNDYYIMMLKSQKSTVLKAQAGETTNIIPLNGDDNSLNNLMRSVRNLVVVKSKNSKKTSVVLETLDGLFLVGENQATEPVSLILTFTQGEVSIITTIVESNYDKAVVQERLLLKKEAKKFLAKIFFTFIALASPTTEVYNNLFLSLESYALLQIQQGEHI